MRGAAPLRAVIFDWDGTLVDSAEPSYRCFVRMFSEFGIEFSRETYASTYSPNWYHTFQRVGLPEDRWPEADRLWIENFACESPQLIDGVGAHPARHSFAPDQRIGANTLGD